MKVVLSLLLVVFFAVSVLMLSLHDTHTLMEIHPIAQSPWLMRFIFLDNRVAVSQYYLIRVAMDIFRICKYSSLECERLYLSYKADPNNSAALFFLANVVPCNKRGAITVLRYLKASLCIKDTWRGYMYIGFLYYFYLEDYSRAAKYFRLSARMPNSKPYVRSLALMAYYRSGRLTLAKQYLLSVYHSTNDKRRKKILLRKIRWIDTLIILNKTVVFFKKIEGRYPRTLRELVEKGYIKKIPVDPFGKGYYIDPNTHRVKSRI
ncbi:MAG: hypothetical protein J7L41_04305 [Synergistetes bacterium]|nr:hypothetical protein [Synergistota bacterium]